MVNAVAAAALAVVVALFSRIVRRPALIHVLWLVVLLKLVTPPLVEFPVGFEIPVLQWDEPTDSQATKIAGRDNPRPVGMNPEVSPSVVTSDDSQLRTADSGNEAAAAPRLTAADWVARIPWRSVSWIWLIGAGVSYLVQTGRLLWFARYLYRAASAPRELQLEVQELAERMGLRHIPEVMLVSGRISPMLWGFGARAKVLFPTDLVDRLHEESTATLLAHELAHFRRGDHWVRVLELIVGGLFWWHPVVWWARRQIEITEEQCCDACVVEQFSSAPRRYADALLETLDFLSESRFILPPAGSGANSIPFIRERLRLIMRGLGPQRLSPAAWLSVFAAAALVLPVFPVSSPVDELSLASATISSDEVSLPADREPDRASSERPFSRKRNSRPALRVHQPQTAATAPAPHKSEEEVSGHWMTAVSPDGRFEVTLQKFGELLLRDRQTDEQFDLSPEQIACLAFSPDSVTLAVAKANSIELREAATQKVLGILEGHPAPVQSIMFNPDGRSLVSASRDGTVKSWDLATHNETASITYRGSPINCIAIAPDARIVAVATGHWMSASGGRVALLSLPALLPLADPLECETAVGAVAFQPESESLVTGEWNGRVRFWNPTTRLETASVFIPKDLISAARFSPNAMVFSHLDAEQARIQWADLNRPPPPPPEPMEWIIDLDGATPLRPLRSSTSGLLGY